MNTTKIKTKLATEGNYWSFLRYTMADILDVYPLGTNLPKTISRKLAKNTETDAEVIFDDEGIVIEASKDNKKFSERLDLNNLEVSDEGWHLVENEYKRVLTNLNEWKGSANVETGTPVA